MAETIEEIEQMTKNLLVPHDIYKILGCDQYSINLQAQADPKKLGFPVIVMGRRVKIPREGFLRWWKYGNVVIEK